MAVTSYVPGIRKPGKLLKPKRCATGKTHAIPTPLGRKRLCLAPLPYGKRRCEHGCCNEAPDMSDQSEFNCLTQPSEVVKKRFLPYGKRRCEHGCCNESPDMSDQSEFNCSLEEDLSTVPIPPPPPNCMRRGQQGIVGWWRKTDSETVLGHLKDCMQSFARHCLLSVQAPHTKTLQVLSLSDGSINEKECVPTSVLLAHAFASLDIDALPLGLENIKIFGADVYNPREVYRDPQRQSWMPPWLDLQHVCLDNKKNFVPQLHKCGLCAHSAKFDIVLMRQGLCYCDDHSFNVRPPKMLRLTGIKGDYGAIGPSGTYILEPSFRYGRPSYRKGKYLLLWRPPRSDWAVVEDNEACNVWANVCNDSGSPALAQAPWWVWDGKDFVIDDGISCTVVGTCPWRRPPDACKSCAGISLDAAAMKSFVGRVASVLNTEKNPKAFALLHGGYYKGIESEVKEFYSELEVAAEGFNSSKSCICASVLRRQESQDAENDPMRYWNKINGLLLSTRLE